MPNRGAQHRTAQCSEKPCDDARHSAAKCNVVEWRTETRGKSKRDAKLHRYDFVSTARHNATQFKE